MTDTATKLDRAALDDWFARAEDVLTDWQPSGDAMVATVPTTESDDLAPVGDSYYTQAVGDALESSLTFYRSPVEYYTQRALVYIAEQGRPPWADLSRWHEVGYTEFPAPAAVVMDVGSWAAANLAPFIEAINTDARRFAVEMVASWRPVPPTVPVIDTGGNPRDRALTARRNRNTGPAETRGLDGRTRRRAGSQR